MQYTVIKGEFTGIRRQIPASPALRAAARFARVWRTMADMGWHTHHPAGPKSNKIICDPAVTLMAPAAHVSLIIVYEGHVQNDVSRPEDFYSLFTDAISKVFAKWACERPASR